MKKLINLALIALLTQCTVVTPKFLGAVGTDMEDVDYQANATAGTVSFKAKSINNSRATKEVASVAKFGITAWGTVKSLEAVADGVSAMAKKETDLASIAAKKETDALKIGAETEALKITTEAAAEAAP